MQIVYVKAAEQYRQLCGEAMFLYRQYGDVLENETEFIEKHQKLLASRNRQGLFGIKGLIQIFDQIFDVFQTN